MLVPSEDGWMPSKNRFPEGNLCTQFDRSNWAEAFHPCEQRKAYEPKLPLLRVLFEVSIETWTAQAIRPPENQESCLPDRCNPRPRITERPLEFLHTLIVPTGTKK
jgi:hypothetical protein